MSDGWHCSRRQSFSMVRASSPPALCFSLFRIDGLIPFCRSQYSVLPRSFTSEKSLSYFMPMFSPFLVTYSFNVHIIAHNMYLNKNKYSHKQGLKIVHIAYWYHGLKSVQYSQGTRERQSGHTWLKLRHYSTVNVSAPCFNTDKPTVSRRFTVA